MTGVLVDAPKTRGRKAASSLRLAGVMLTVLVAAAGCFGGDGDRAAPRPSGNPLTSPGVSSSGSALPASPSTDLSTSAGASAGASPGASASADAAGSSGTSQAGPGGSGSGSAGSALSRSGSAATGSGSEPTQGSSSSKRRRPGFIDGIFGSSPGGGCFTDPAGTTGIEVRLTRLDGDLLCFEGYRMDTPAMISLTSPTGAVTRFPADRKDDTWRWRLSASVSDTQFPDYGRYPFQLTGVVGTRQVTSSGVVIVTPAPRSRVTLKGDFDSNSRALRGGRIVVDVAGFPARSTVYLTVFGPGPNPAGYTVIEDLPDLVTNERGEGSTQWAIAAGAAGGSYGIWVDPTPAVNDDCEAGSLCLFFEIE